MPCRVLPKAGQGESFCDSLGGFVLRLGKVAGDASSIPDQSAAALFLVTLRCVKALGAEQNVQSRRCRAEARHTGKTIAGRGNAVL